MGIGLLKIVNRNQNNNKWTTGIMNNFLSNIKRSIVDATKVGDVFILVFKNETGVRKIAHHALLVDVAGASSEVYLRGVLLHLTARATTRKSKFRFGDKSRRRNIFYEIVYIGKIVPPIHIHSTKPREWACSLIMLGNEVFDELTNNETDTIWSSSINCQIFCKVLLQRFGFQWPTDLPCIDDDTVPIIVDLSIAFISSTARKHKKTVDHDDSDNTTDDE
ncbi:unnamed protein product [Rotaria sp. Silwood2]|nr:unnamed protein product [Rotaria sp. Silwood2]CAF3156497.1 unnamed protein product [Rotaria sp. Silwood2]CAF3454672.1 unnamed protein product [Rotaria sp. Silwood2]CAF4380758.1 unnamed protein product [Rotaria sp. Silwood2]CAF4498085.1 unnamed protein product [Rotaria sp. Silwood2]